MKKINKLYCIGLLLSISSSPVLAYTCPTVDELRTANNTARANQQTQFVIHEPYGDFEPVHVTNSDIEDDLIFSQAGVFHDKNLINNANVVNVQCVYTVPSTQTQSLLQQKAASINQLIAYNGSDPSKWTSFNSQDAYSRCDANDAESCIFIPAPASKK